MNTVFHKIYRTPPAFSDLIMTGDGEFLTALDFIRTGNPVPSAAGDPGMFRETERWLDLYFSGRDPRFLPVIRMDGMTDFRRAVTEILLKIPYGETRSYGEIAREIAAARCGSRVSAQAVGGAVGRNPICILVPCHRVIGADGSMTGFGGGIENKIALLKLEGSLPDQRSGK